MTCNRRGHNRRTLKKKDSENNIQETNCPEKNLSSQWREDETHFKPEEQNNVQTANHSQKTSQNKQTKYYHGG